MQVVLDANIYISALIFSKGNSAAIIERWLAGEFDVLISQPIIDELLRVTGYERLHKKFRRIRENRLEFVALVSEQGVWIQPETQVTAVAADESDNRYLECAVAGSANYVVSGDDHLLNIGSYKGIGIVSPAAFIILLDSGIA